MPQPEPQFDDLYREVILDHYRRPRNRGALAIATQRVDGVNPVCGDEVHLDIHIAGDTISDIAFAGLGCSISQASASMLTERIKGRTIDEASEVMAKFRAMMIAGAPPAADLGDLEALEGVAKLPVRVKCALLSWNVLQEGLNQASTAA
jgi:nitrogen fixation protein NifU and related proteins